MKDLKLIPIPFDDGIKAMSYDETASEDIKELLLNRVFLVKPNILYIKEIPVASTFTIKYIMDHCIEMGSSLKPYGLIVDLRAVVISPNNSIKEIIIQKFIELSNDAHHICFVTDRFIIKTAIKFIFRKFTNLSFDILKNPEDALRILESTMHQLSNKSVS